MRGELDEQATETKAVIAQHELAAAEYSDPVIDTYKKDVDRTLLREKSASAFRGSNDAWTTIFASVAFGRAGGFECLSCDAGR